MGLFLKKAEDFLKRKIYTIISKWRDTYEKNVQFVF